MGSAHAVIVGASHAAAQLATSLRQGGWNGDISIVGAEAIPPYHRPPLSKAYLAGDKHSDELLIRPATFYEKSEIDLVLGTRVNALDRENKVITLHDGGNIPYTKLALTTGASVRKLELPGHQLDDLALPGCGGACARDARCRQREACRRTRRDPHRIASCRRRSRSNGSFPRTRCCQPQPSRRPPCRKLDRSPWPCLAFKGSATHRRGS